MTFTVCFTLLYYYVLHNYLLHGAAECFTRVCCIVVYLSVLQSALIKGLVQNIPMVYCIMLCHRVLHFALLQYVSNRFTIMCSTGLYCNVVCNVLFQCVAQ